jgi:hypothetical protein
MLEKRNGKESVLSTQKKTGKINSRSSTSHSNKETANVVLKESGGMGDYFIYN